MKQRKNLLLAVAAMLIVAVFAFSGCGNDADVEKDSGSIENGTTATDTDREIAENDLAKEEKQVTYTLTSLKEDDELTEGSANISGKIEEGEVKEVKVKIELDDETVIGEGTALVADVSKEFTATVKYSIPDEKRGDSALDAKVKLTFIGMDGNDLKEESVYVKVK